MMFFGDVAEGARHGRRPLRLLVHYVISSTVGGESGGPSRLRIHKSAALHIGAGGWAFGAQRCCAPTGRNRAGLRALLGADEVAAAVLLPAGFGALGAEGLFFAEAYGADAIGGDAQGDEILLYCAGAAIAKSEVVFGGAALVAMAFDGYANAGVIAQEFGGLG